ncbi:hypothetical protein BDW74DRAFT_181183 [Aspergillus multicolor]|uniref:uncharacterized protein n=1 Tax=Aspergillus multicolor TaxID=41759 RepID=UPI003CCE2224
MSFLALFSQELSLGWGHLGTLAVGALGCYLAHVLYLLYLHPLAAFPGPRLAALSTWWLYRVSRAGRADQVFEELHRKYNTRALRISPNELHIQDSSLYHTIYSQDHAYAKDAYFYAAFGTPHSLFVETDRTLHRQRRKMLNNFFSKSSIRNMQGLLYQRVDKLCLQIVRLSDKGPMNIYNAIRCMTVDLITDIGFGNSFDLTDKARGSGFETDFLQAFNLVATSIWEFMYLPVTRFLVGLLPLSVTIALGGPSAHMARLVMTVSDTVTKFRSLKATGKSESREVVFDGLVGLNDGEMKAEATDILVAGSDTTATTLSVAIFQLCKNPKVYDELKREIRQQHLQAAEDFNLTALEKLPYLTAVVKEALRFANAVPGRLPRVVPPAESGAAPLVVDGKAIPPGTTVGISAAAVHSDPSIWGSDARSFKPERWLQGDAKQLEKYLVTFSKGARQCLGINLAYAELTLALAVFTTRFDFTLDETMKLVDMDIYDGFTAAYRGTGPRARVWVL